MEQAWRMGKSEVSFTGHEPCPECGSSDALARYADGHAYCFRCQHYEHGDNTGAADVQPRRRQAIATGLIEGTFAALIKRGITEETCRKFGYRVGTLGGKGVQLADYCDETGAVIAQKVRGADKSFSTVGNFKAVQLFGQHLWGASRKIVVTEGEIDCMSVSQIQSNKWPVVSVPNGAQGAAKAIARNLKFFDQFEQVVLMFDMDEAGREAVAECAPLFPVGKVAVASLPLKDPSEMLMTGRGAEVINAIWQAKPWRPEGSVKLSDIREAMKAPIRLGLPWFLPSLTELTYGRRYGEIYTLGAGTGVGKTDFLTQQIAYDLTTLKEKVSVIFLEQQPVETGLRIAGKACGRTLHIPGSGWTDVERDAAIDSLCSTDDLDLYDHFGCAEWDRLQSHIRYLAKAEGYRIFYLDHLTALADTGADERGSLEKIMGSMGSLVKELDIMLILVSHLTTPEHGSHEEGARVTIRQFKGSRAIGFWSHYMIGLERDQQDEDVQSRQVTTLRILKDRYTGKATGQTLQLAYDPLTGLSKEVTSFDQMGSGLTHDPATGECPF